MMLALLFILSAHAQDLPSYTVLPPVIVSPQPLTLAPEPDLVVEVPATATPKAATLDDILRGVPGAVVARSGGAGQPSTLFLRGAASEHTLVLLDGVLLNDPSQPAGGFDFSTIDINMVERVEIYKGPQTLRFGAGAVGGVVNIVSRKGGGPRRFNGAAKIGSRQTNRESATAVGQRGAIEYLVSVTRFESEGISAARGYPELDGHRYWALATSLGSNSANDERWELRNRTVSSRSDLDFAPATSGPYFIEPDDPNYAVEGLRSVSSFKFERRSEKWSSDLVFAHAYLRRRYENKPDARNNNHFLDIRHANTFQGEKIHTYKFDPRTSVTFGPAARIEKSGKFNDSLYGAFADFSFKKNWRFGAGVRYDHHSRFGGQFSYAVSPGYRFATGTTLTARWATAFKSPSLYQLHDFTYGNPWLLPEKVRGEEVSAEQVFGDNQILRVTGFRYLFTDLIQFSTRYANLASARTSGVEFEYALEPAPGMDWQIAYTYTDARNEGTGERLLRRPFASWRASCGWRSGERWSLRAEYRGMGSRPDIDTRTSAKADVPAYDVLDISTTMAFTRQTHFSVGVENAFGTSYEEVAGYATPGFGVFVGLSHIIGD